jgi:hypothetical protein
MNQIIDDNEIIDFLRNVVITSTITTFNYYEDKTKIEEANTSDQELFWMDFILHIRFGGYMNRYVEDVSQNITEDMYQPLLEYINKVDSQKNDMVITDIVLYLIRRFVYITIMELNVDEFLDNYNNNISLK